MVDHKKYPNANRCHATRIRHVLHNPIPGRLLKLALVLVPSKMHSESLLSVETAARECSQIEGFRRWIRGPAAEEF